MADAEIARATQAGHGLFTFVATSRLSGVPVVLGTKIGSQRKQNPGRYVSIVLNMRVIAKEGHAVYHSSSYFYNYEQV